MTKRSRTPRRALDVWLYGHRIATLSEPSRYRYRLDFTDEALDIHGEGARVLSLSLPISARPVIDSGDRYDHRVSSFLEGLLPEGNLRRHIATAAGVPHIDKMSMLERVGAECAGAVQFLTPGRSPYAGSVRKLSSTELGRLIADLPTYHLPVGATPQASLAGIQDKVLLTALGGDEWGWPEYGAASTHLIKPEPIGAGALPNLIEAEDWSLHVARSADIPAAGSRLATFGGRRAIVVERYDRTPPNSADGVVERVHQEDFCQALGLDPEAKYESTSEYESLGSRLGRIASLASDRAMDPQRLRTDLIAAVTFNVVTGNGDAHSKNYSLLIGERGQVSLAPIYDAAPVMFINPRYKGTGHVINGRTNIDGVHTEDLVTEASSWGLGRSAATRAVVSTMERVYQAVAESPTMFDDQVRARLTEMWARRSWAIPKADSAGANPDSRDATKEGHVFVRSYVDRAGRTVRDHWRSRPVR